MPPSRPAPVPAREMPPQRGSPAYYRPGPPPGLRRSVRHDSRRKRSEPFTQPGADPFQIAVGFGITAACRRYLEPLIQGEDYPPYRQGLPSYVALRNQSVPKRLGKFVIK